LKGTLEEVMTCTNRLCSYSVMHKSATNHPTSINIYNHVKMGASFSHYYWDGSHI